MTHIRNSAAAGMAALFLLGACSSEPEVIGQATDPQREALKNAAPVELPPAIEREATYRCKDNSLVHITFMDDDKTVIVRDKQEQPPRETLRAPQPGEPFVAEGYRLEGNGSTVTYTSPDAAAQSCRSN